MNQRQRNKKLKAAVAAKKAKPSLQEAWDVVAEHLAAEAVTCAFVDVDWDMEPRGQRLRLYDLGNIRISSKPVRGV